VQQATKLKPSVVVKVNVLDSPHCAATCVCVPSGQDLPLNLTRTGQGKSLHQSWQAYMQAPP